MSIKKKNKSTLRLTIEVNTNQELSEQQKDIVMNDMAARLHGYQTDPLLFLSGAEIIISRTIRKSNSTTNFSKVIPTKFCDCEKPWSVSGKCIICHRPIKID